MNSVLNAADRSRRQTQETCCVVMALERWSFSLGRVEFGIGRLKGVE